MANVPEFWPGSRIAAYAQANGLSQRDAIAALLSQAVWPERFRRNYGLLSAQAQTRLLNLPLFIAGCGGLGGQIAPLLARLGAGRILLCDCDRFEESNLNRQRFCTEKNLGQEKAVATAKGLAEIASFGEYEPLVARITSENAQSLVADSAIVIDCLDSVAGKKMLEQASAELGKAFLHGSVLHEEGFAFLADPATGSLARLYNRNFSASGSGAILDYVVSGTAAIMCGLFINWLAGKSGQPRLLHCDFSVPELESFQLP